MAMNIRWDAKILLSRAVVKWGNILACNEVWISIKQNIFIKPFNLCICDPFSCFLLTCLGHFRWLLGNTPLQSSVYAPNMLINAVCGFILGHFSTDSCSCCLRLKCHRREKRVCASAGRVSGSALLAIGVWHLVWFRSAETIAVKITS